MTEARSIINALLKTNGVTSERHMIGDNVEKK
jgi:hypothetical protein